MNAIVRVDENWGIGYKNNLISILPEDMAFFREKTLGKVVVMGRKTLESFPGGKPLKNRTNIVLTTDASYQADGAFVVHSEEELYEKLSEFDSNEIYIIGGASVYKRFIDRCRFAYVTKMHKAFTADTYFPNLDDDEKWEVAKISEMKTFEDYEYQYVTYENKEVL